MKFFKEHTYWVIEEITIFLTFYFLIKYNYLQCCVTQCCVSFWCVAERFILFYILFHYICYRILNIVPSAIWRTLLYICLGSGTPLQYFCLENPMDGGAWYAAVHGVARVGHDWATSLSLFTFMHWRRKWQPTPVFLPGESQGREAWWAAIYGLHRVGHDWSNLAAAAVGNESAGNVGEPGSNSGLGRSPGEGNGNPLQYSCLENSMDRRAQWGYCPCGHKESDTTE